MQPVNNTPVTGYSVWGAPVVYRDAQSDLTVLMPHPDFPTTLPDNGLFVFSPATGNAIAIPTRLTTPYVLSGTVTNGVLYVGGTTLNVGQGPSQIFAIRVDQAVQDLRDFI